MKRLRELMRKLAKYVAKTAKEALCGVAVAAPLVTAGPAVAEGTAIFAVIDNSAALQNAAEAQKFEAMLAYQIAQLRTKRETATARVSFISVNNPRNIWVGDTRRLFVEGQQITPLFAPVENGCSDLVGAFEAVRTGIELARPDKTYVYVFSSLIATGAPCDNVTVELPQAAPAGLKLGFLSAPNVEVRFYWVHHLQARNWLDAIKAAGIRRFQLNDEQTTKAVLQEGL